ncbi:MAG TPA: T9SS type A sorting domain-containing protein [Bacteroidia bacterium]|nr:T9SS type A sorting domain-containing protein [Bacteroidia bacterium]
MLIFRSLSRADGLEKGHFNSPLSSINNLPEVSGIDGTEDFVSRVCPGTPLCFDIFTELISENQEIVMDWDSSIPGASFSTDGKAAPVGHFCWTPNFRDARPESYNFTVTAYDESNPLINRKVYTYSIFVDNLAVSLQTVPVSCSGKSDGTVTAIVSGGEGQLLYSWAHSSESTAVSSGLSGGYYTVTVSDDFGCSAVSTTFVPEPKNLSINMEVTPSGCQESNGTAKATVTGGSLPYHYSWFPQNGEEAFATSLKAGWHTLFIEDANGCLASSQVKVPGAGLEISAETIVPASCEDTQDGSAKLSVSGNTGAYSIQWIPEVSRATEVYGLASGVYEAIVKDDAGCSFTLPVTIGFRHTLPTLDLGGDQILPEGESLFLDAGPGFKGYLWSDFSTGEVLEARSPGTYSILVTDDFGCKAIDAVELRNEASVAIPQPSGIETFRVFPNPAKDKVIVSFSNPMKKQISFQVTTSWGAAVYVRTPELSSSVREEINIQDLPSGIYLINVGCGDKIFSKKLIKL